MPVVTVAQLQACQTAFREARTLLSSQINIGTAAARNAASFELEERDRSSDSRRDSSIPEMCLAERSRFRSQIFECSRIVNFLLCLWPPLLQDSRISRSQCLSMHGARLSRRVKVHARRRPYYVTGPGKWNQTCIHRRGDVF